MRPPAWLTRRVLAALCLLALALATPASAADGVDRYQRLEQMHHTAWTAKDGLVGRPTCLAQSTDGFLWIGTTNGLYRFDGIAFERFQPEQGSLPALQVESLFATRDGGLWVGFTGGGATFIAADGRLTSYSSDSGLPLGAIRDIAQDLDGVTWVAATGGLARLEGGRWRQVRMDWNYPCRSAWRVYVDRRGTLWVGAASPDRTLYLPKGARRFVDTGLDTSATSFAQIDDERVAIGARLRQTIHEARQGADGTMTLRTVVGTNGNYLAIDRDGGLWMASNGVYRMRLDAVPTGATYESIESIVEYLGSENGVSGRFGDHLLVDREGSVWLATDSGLDRFRRRNLTWQTDPRLTLNASFIRDAEGHIWIASQGAPHFWRADTNEAPVTLSRTIFRGYGAPDGTIWLMPGQGLLRFDKGRATELPPPREVTERGYNYSPLAVTSDRAGRLWVALNGIGEFRVENGEWTFVPILPGRPDWTASAAHTDAAGRVWLVYRNELAMVDGDVVRVMGAGEGLALGPVLAITSRNDEVWVAGELGVAVWRGRRFERLVSSGTDFGVVNDILPTRDALWLTTAAGIVRIPAGELDALRRDPGRRVRHELFDLVSDLPEGLKIRGQGSVAAEARDGALWFITNSGLARLDPRLVVRNAVPPPIVIRAVNADDTAYAPRGVVSLPALTRTLRIDYTALSLAIPERVRFRYRLDGWETEWHEAGTRRTVFYTDLKPGGYTFRVLACNNDGVWNETGATLAFTVAPAWYQTWWFTALVIAAMGAAVAGMYRIRLRRVSAALSARFDERLAERTRIARELHDTLLQTVQGSKMVADDALERAEDADHVRHALERLSDWLGRAVTEGRAALNSLRASTIDVNDLAESFRRAANSPARPPTLHVAVAVHGAVRDLHPIVRDEIFRIGEEAIRNAFAHARATRLDVALEYAHDLTLRVSDNGVGLDAAIAERGREGRFGLPGMRERAANIGAALTIDSSSAGARLTLVVPGRAVYRGSRSH